MLFNELEIFKQIVKNKHSYFYEGPFYSKCNAYFLVVDSEQMNFINSLFVKLNQN